MPAIGHRLGDNDPIPDLPPRRRKWTQLATDGSFLDVWHEPELATVKLHR